MTHTREIQKPLVDRSGCVSKTNKTSPKKSSSKTGSSVKVELDKLNTSISIAKGILAILSSEPKLGWINKLATKEAQHSQILLKEVMEEIWNAELSLMNLESELKKKYMGICLL